MSKSIPFDDKFVDEGNMNDRYDEQDTLNFKDTFGVPNYIDAMDLEKYTINLKRTFMTGKH